MQIFFDTNPASIYLFPKQTKVQNASFSGIKSACGLLFAFPWITVENTRLSATGEVKVQPKHNPKFGLFFSPPTRCTQQTPLKQDNIKKKDKNNIFFRFVTIANFSDQLRQAAENLVFRCASARGF